MRIAKDGLVDADGKPVDAERAVWLVVGVVPNGCRIVLAAFSRRPTDEEVTSLRAAPHASGWEKLNADCWFSGGKYLEMDVLEMRT